MSTWLYLDFRHYISCGLRERAGKVVSEISHVRTTIQGFEQAWLECPESRRMRRAVGLVSTLAQIKRRCNLVHLPTKERCTTKNTRRNRSRLFRGECGISAVARRLCDRMTTTPLANLSRTAYCSRTNGAMSQKKRLRVSRESPRVICRGVNSNAKTRERSKFHVGTY